MVGITGGESGIRTHVRVSPKHAFQACAFNHSAISPVGEMPHLTVYKMRIRNLLSGYHAARRPYRKNRRENSPVAFNSLSSFSTEGSISLPSCHSFQLVISTQFG